MIAHFLKLLNNISVYERTSVWLSTHLLKNILIATIFHTNAGFCVYMFPNYVGRYQETQLLNHVISLFSFVGNFQSLFQYEYPISHFHKQ